MRDSLEKRLKETSEELAEKYPKTNAIILFGSRARGDFRENSDADVSIFYNGKYSLEALNVFESNSPDVVVQATLVNRIRFKDFLSKHHSFIYCIFRDGKVLYQKKDWFDKNREEILKLKPKKQTAKRYILSALRILCTYPSFEDSKRAANLVGFGLLMLNGIYPTSPHTLKKQLQEIDLTGFKEIGKNIQYVQNRYYKGKTQRITRKYKKSLDFLEKTASKFLQKT